MQQIRDLPADETDCVINHPSLGYPLVVVMDHNGHVIHPEVQYLDYSSLIIRFADAAPGRRAILQFA